MKTNIQIKQDDLTGPEIAALLEEHLRSLFEVTPVKSRHALNLNELRKPDITFWSAWIDRELAGCAALKQLTAEHGEIKSMRTAKEHFRKGVASALLEHVISEARRRGYRRLSLETGAMPYFKPAHALYRKFGFTPCPAFADYTEDPNSVFMTKVCNDPLRVIRCEPHRHAEAILAIFNDAIVNSTALYDYKPRTMEMMAAWFETKAKGKYPVIGIENEAGELMGFGSYGTFRAWPAYKYSVEHSVYVDARFRGRGIGKRVLEEVIATAQEQDYHVLVGVIDASNTVSIRLHERLGFSCAGTIRQAGFKFGRWLNVSFYQLVLPTPSSPSDG